MSPPPKSSCTVYIARSAQLQLLSDYWWPSQWPASPYPRSWLLWTISAFACPYFRYHNLHSNHSRYLNNLKVEAKFYGRVRATKTLETVPLCENFSSTSTVYNMQCKSTSSCIVMLLTKKLTLCLPSSQDVALQLVHFWPWLEQPGWIWESIHTQLPTETHHE
jgi:hypothetical protein